ncbi:hypothetical protein OH799_23835 [Nocardia sp. NBC_00881]|nr:hypothetical protein OH799_23835 [Nocardia sp. NBC_00881]
MSLLITDTDGAVCGSAVPVIGLGIRQYPLTGKNNAFYPEIKINKQSAQ